MLLFYFKDTLLGKDGVWDSGGNEVIGEQPGKGELSLGICQKLFEALEEDSLKTHLVRALNEREILVQKMDCIPLEVLCRNLAFGSYLRRHKDCEALKPLNSFIEFSLKSDAEEDPLLTKEQILQRQIASPEELTLMKELVYRTNHCLQNFLKGPGILLVDFKMEFGRKDGNIRIIDDLSPDTARFMSVTNPKKILTHEETAALFGIFSHV